MKSTYSDYTHAEILLGLCNTPLSNKAELRENVLHLVAIGVLPSEYGIATDICTLTCLHEFVISKLVLAYLLGLSIDNVDFIALLSTLADWLQCGKSKRFICKRLSTLISRKLLYIERVRY